MGLYSDFPSPVEGLVHVLSLIVNTIWSVAQLKNMVRTAPQVMSESVNTTSTPPDSEEGSSTTDHLCPPMSRTVSTTRFGSLCGHNRSNDLARTTSTGNTWSSIMECCVCLSRFEADEEVSELSCKHFFHKGCLQKWFENHHHTTCPLCRSIL